MVGAVYDDAMPKPVTPPRIKVINKDSVVIGHVLARIGLLTYAGPITRFTEKSVWCRSKDGAEHCYRLHDGRVPATYRHRVRASEFISLQDEFLHEGC